MKAVKNHQEDEEDEDEEFGATKDVTPSTNTNLTKDGNCDKANTIRSKHSVTEQRRRSKINERYQILRGLIPNSDQKRDTASFLLEVIHYVQFLQERVQKYESSYQTWGLEPAKLMPWRSSHWHVQPFVGQPQTLKNACPGSTTFHENIPAIKEGIHSVQQHNHIEAEVNCGSMKPESDDTNKAMAIPLHLQANTPVPIINDGAFSHMLHGAPQDRTSTDCPSTCDSVNLHDELAIESGTIRFSSVYSQGLLISLAQALQTTGLDLSQATISVEINLGKRADQNSLHGDDGTPVTPGNQPVGNFQEASNSDDMNQVPKRRKT